MPILKTKKAIQTRLTQAFPTTPIAYEGVSFDPPDALHMRVQFVPGNPTDSVYGTKYYRENISFQVFVLAEANKGTSEVLTFAESVRELFDRGTSIDVDNIRIHVFTKPRVAGVGYADGRVLVPIYIQLTVEVND